MYADVEFRNPAVREELKKWGEWYIKETGIDGFRLDAVKHMSPGFYQEWLDHMRTMKSGLFAVGEYWAPGELELLLRYIDATGGRMSLFDSSLHHNFYHASNGGKDFDLRTILDDSLVKVKPELAVTVVDNHDTQPLQSLEAPVEHWFKPLAYALILLREGGYPCVFLSRSLTEHIILTKVAMGTSMKYFWTNVRISKNAGGKKSIFLRYPARLTSIIPIV
jgi:alpha-amylase